MYAWLRSETSRALIPQFLMLSVVSSVALNTTLIIRERELGARSFRLQREVLQNLREQLRMNRSATLARSPEICRQLVKVGLKPSDYGLDNEESAHAEADVVPFHRDLSWFDVFFSRRKVDQQYNPKSTLSSETDWEKELANLIEELEQECELDDVST
ncbi:hypothetical protein CBS14141_002655 [Malassezia furfur]|nr:hypothetical protein CBS14141_002655 [Malassezia furfur]